MNTNETKVIMQDKASAKINFYLLLNISLLITLPLLSILSAHIFEKEIISTQLIAKWFIFWAVGIRLFTAGIKQASDPAFTAKQIFKITEKESYVVVRELGYANISLGVMGILSVINDEWRIMAAVCGGLFFGFAALQHSLRKPDSRNELVALLYDAVVFIALAAWLLSLI